MAVLNPNPNPAPTPIDLVLLTGATGHLGFSVLLESLRAGLHVRCAVRSERKANTLLSHPLIQEINPGARLSIAIVPCMGEPGAYDEASKGVSHIIHLASQLPDGTKDLSEEKVLKETIEPTVNGTLEILKSAQKAGTVKRVIISSSAAAIIDVIRLSTMSPKERANLPPITPDNLFKPLPPPFLNSFHVYTTAKVAALTAAEAWMAQNSPSFDLIHTMASFVIGPNYLWTSKKDPNILGGSNVVLLRIVLGQNGDEKPHFLPPTTVHMDDFVRVHLGALDSNVPGNTRYLLNYRKPGSLSGQNWEEVPEIVQGMFPDEVEKGILPNKGKNASIWVPVDGDSTEEVFGFTYKSFEEQVRDVVQFYLKLPDDEP